jgi:hypothetical protein
MVLNLSYYTTSKQAASNCAYMASIRASSKETKQSAAGGSCNGDMGHL